MPTNRNRPRGVVGCVLVALLTVAAAPATRPAAERSFTFTYAATLKGLTVGRPVRVWVPMPPSDATQDVALAPSGLPTTPEVNVEPRFGNRIAHFTLGGAHKRTVSFNMNYRVTRRVVAGPTTCPVAAGAGMADPAALLRPDAKVPVGGRPGHLLDGLTLATEPTARAKQLFDLVDDRMAYRKDAPGWGTGDAAWACDSRFGNCTDFHSLYISLARTANLPSVFQIGFPIGPAPAGPVAGYHCWAWSKVNAGWLPVDVSEANQRPDRRADCFGRLDADRVAFTVGRDLDLVPKQAGPPLNFFVNPYVEVGGEPLPADQVVTAYSYGPADGK